MVLYAAGFDDIAPATGNVFSEAALLAQAAYSDTSGLARAGGWRPAPGAALGLPAAGLHDGGAYRFEDGVYVHVDADNSAVAHVYLDGTGRTLALAFRGTDEVPGDFLEQLSYADHYARFAPLLAAVGDRFEEGTVDRVLVTGHSLGAAMATTAMVREGWTEDDRVFAVAIGSHGTDAAIAAEASGDASNLVNIVHTRDALALGARPSDPAPDALGSVFPDAAGTLAKERVGVEVRIDSGTADRFVAGASPFDLPGRLVGLAVAEHDLDRYRADIDVLAAAGRLDPEDIVTSPRHDLAVDAGLADVPANSAAGELWYEDLAPPADVQQTIAETGDWLF